jgi:hypothetical protein
MRISLIATVSAIMLMLIGGVVWNANASPMGVPSLPNYSPSRQWIVQVRGGVDGVLIGFVVRTAGADALPAVT